MERVGVSNSVRLSVAIAAAEAPPDAFVVWRGFRESFAKAARSGYQGVELALKTAEDVSPTLLGQWLAQNDLEVSCISTGQVFATLGLFFTHPDGSVRDRAVEVFNGLVDLAADFGGLVNVGRARGSYRADQPLADTERLFVQTVQRICDYAQPKGVTILIEPVNRYEINFVNSVAQGAEIVKRVDRENLGLMPDLFHMNIEDDRIGDTLARFGPLVRYIHVADSNRRAPGSGHLDFFDAFRGLRQARFRGWASVEILPLPDPDTAAERAAQTLKPMIEEYNRSLDDLLSTS